MSSTETVQTQQNQKQQLQEYDFNIIRLADKDAIRIREEKIPEGSISRIVHTPMGNVNRRKQKKHGYFSARA